MVPDEAAQKPTGKPGAPSKPAAASHLVLKLANEDELQEFLTQLPKDNRLLGVFGPDGKLRTRPGEQPVPRPKFAPPPKAAAPQK